MATNPGSVATTLTIALATMLTACSAEGPVTVELDVFSGRPNPEWQLTGEEAAELRRRLSDLPPADVKPPPPRLGYRGFNVAGAGRISDEVGIADGFVFSDRWSDRSAAYHDARQAELWLQDLARQRGFAALVPAPPSRP